MYKYIMSFKTDPDYNETPEEVDTYDSSYEINSWDELDIPADLLRGIFGHGFEKPSPIQKKAIKPIILKKDIIAQAQSGTGKTATFTIGALSNVNTKDKDVQVMVLSPTRELSIQTANVFNAIGSMMEGLEVQILIGGNSIDEDIQNLKNKHPQVVVGCPGRVFDMIRRNTFNSRKVKLVILDEADEMFSSGFKEQVYNIFQSLHKDIQVALFSATMPSYIYPITQKLMREPIRISVKAEQLTLDGITQYFVAVEDDKQKYNTLKNLYSLISVSQCIIYCNSVKRVSDLYEAMTEDGFPVCCIHSSMDKVARDNAFMEFRHGKFRVLISSNVTARGIDIQQVSVVINFDICKCVHTYLHRIGRSGRWGRRGVGINLITRRDISKMKEIEAHYACEIKEMPNTIDSL
jgi:translation initiation factor 4A